jgi:hypothetical protein
LRRFADQSIGRSASGPTRMRHRSASTPSRMVVVPAARLLNLVRQVDRSTGSGLTVRVSG